MEDAVMRDLLSTVAETGSSDNILAIIGRRKE